MQTRGKYSYGIFVGTCRAVESNISHQIAHSEIFCGFSVRPEKYRDKT